MHVLSPSLYEHERFRELPRLDLDAAKAQMEQLVARARAEEPSYAGLQHRYEDGGFSEEQAKQHPRDAAASELTGMQREELFKELIALAREIARLRGHPGARAVAARRDQERAQRDSREVRRRAAHRDHRRG